MKSQRDYVRAFARSGPSVTRYAGRLGVSKQAVSRRLKRLEQRQQLPASVPDLCRAVWRETGLAILAERSALVDTDALVGMPCERQRRLDRLERQIERLIADLERTGSVTDAEWARVTERYAAIAAAMAGAYPGRKGGR